MPNPRVSVTFTADSTGFTAAVNKNKAQMIDFGEATKRVNHGMVTDVQAISGLLRTSEGGVANNIRAAERWLASIKGVGAAVQGLYPLIGGIAVAGVIGKGVIELTTFIQKIREAGAEFTRQFEEMKNSGRLSNDELERSNIELENQIAKLTGSHENVLAAALIDARVEADKLAQSLAAAQKEMKALLSDNSVSFGSLKGAARLVFGGEAKTSDTEKMINDFDAARTNAGQDVADALAKGDKTAAQAAQAKLDQLMSSQLATSQINRSGRARAQREGHVSGDETANVGMLDAEINTIRSAQDKEMLDRQHTADELKLKQLQDAKNAQDEAASALKQSMDDQLSSMKRDHLVSVAEEMDFWSKSLDAVKGGSAPMLALRVEINKRLAELNQEQWRNFRRLQNLRLPESIKPETDEKAVHEAAGVTKEQVDAQERAGISAARQQAAYEQAVVDLKLATGEMSKLDAAQQSAAIHAREYAAEVAAIQESVDFWKSAPNSPEAQRKIDDGTRQIGDIKNQANISGMEDSANVKSQTGRGAWQISLQQYVQQTRDSAAQVRQIWTEAIDGINDQLSRLFSGQKTNFKGMLQGLAGDIGKIALQRGEGALLGGFLKPDGTVSNPLHVVMAGSEHVIAGAGPGVTGMVQSAVSDAGGFLGKIGSFASSIFSGLGFADGGMPPVGIASLVGERGPELFVPKVAGSVMPNGSFGGDTHHHTINVDARGNTNPAATMAQFDRMLNARMPHIAAATTSATQSARGRMPMSRRS